MSGEEILVSALVGAVFGLIGCGLGIWTQVQLKRLREGGDKQDYRLPDPREEHRRG